MPFGRLGVDHIGPQGAGVTAEQGVVQRAVAPEEALQMEPDEQDGEGVDDPLLHRLELLVTEQHAVGE